MAGDWVKLEKATPHKLEVYRFAEILGVHPRHALGVLVEYFIWLDDNSRDGRISRHFRDVLDTIIGVSNFVDALTQIGWVSSDKRTGDLIVTHFEWHNGKGAKRRALNARANRDHRASRVRDDSYTRNRGQNASLEKRRSKSNPPPHATGEASLRGAPDVSGKRTRRSTTRVNGHNTPRLPNAWWSSDVKAKAAAHALQLPFPDGKFGEQMPEFVERIKTALAEARRSEKHGE